MEYTKSDAKSSKKVQLSFTLKKGVNDEFLKHCEDNLINKSQLIEKLIIEHLLKSNKS